MNRQELIYMIRDYQDAVRYVDGHIKENPGSTDTQLWTNALRKLKKRLEELEECLHLGEYDE